MGDLTAHDALVELESMERLMKEAVRIMNELALSSEDVLRSERFRSRIQNELGHMRAYVKARKEDWDGN